MARGVKQYLCTFAGLNQGVTDASGNEIELWLKWTGNMTPASGKLIKMS